ncbi:NAD-glutamate dehydrogenase [Devosia sp.]|uniref:NAD-glutamate dehydrogenase n=1 Tax=Devosia sp. TaxID=1871048 RepID=UPI0032639557
MTDSAANARTRLMERAEILSASEMDFAQYLSGFAETTDPDDLARYDIDDFVTLLRHSFAHLRDASPTQSRTFIEAAADGSLVVDVVSPDTPFIVDSVLAALRAAGGVVQLFAHPVVQHDGHNISMLHVHSEPVADIAVLRREIETAMLEVGRAVRDWQKMLHKAREASSALQTTKAVLHPALRDEAAYFLGWLTEHNFTFLGTREYRLVDGMHLEPIAGSGLGILEDTELKFLRSGPDYVEMTPQHGEFLKSRDPLLVTKANVRARVHRRAHMDYVGVKRFDADGKLTGELRILGLYTTLALAAPHSEVPIIRRKISAVMARSALDPRSHAGRALLTALDTYPRDELFQIDAHTLFDYANAVAGLYDRPRVRVLPRIDQFDNFVSILVYVPRDRYDSEVRVRINDYLAQVYDGRISAYYPNFPEGELVRLHVIIGRNGGATPRPSRETLEGHIEQLTRNFGDMLLAAAAEPSEVADYRNAFSASYESRNTAEDALADVSVLKTLEDDARIAIRLRNRQGRDGNLGLKFYHRGSAIPLSDRVPMLEHFGFRVIDERTYTVVPRDGVERYIHDMVLAPIDGSSIDVATHGRPIETGLLAVWDGQAESDGFNALILKADLSWDDAALLRALARYLRQLNISYGHRYLAQVMVAQPAAATALVSLFHALHNPEVDDRETVAQAARDSLAAVLDAVTSLDEDTIIRRFLNLIDASVRTNAYQRDANGNRQPALAIKFDCAKVDGMAAPKPFREIFVYSPRVEGVHLRFGAIARGGIRWSDRPEDFRTEVLGLVKAQQVKNAVIVPVGAKGGFFPKRPTAGLARDAVMAEGVASYTIFIGSLLDITDNLVGDTVVPPADVRRLDGDDPYLVVAADKGTATFSDTANAIALGRGFWLGDAFASGGSVGYDHKKMGITARGGWEAVKRHFREMDRDIQTTPFTVAGIGDMSGHVFGNGMLLSPQIHLVAAFDHRDIFIDPTPDPVTSLAERQRLFALPRSSWQDYEKGLISAGGGIYSRTLKSIPLTPEAQKALGLTAASATPQQVMTAILCAEVDLLWFGGIGTYIRSSQETDADAGDRTNDAIRIAANQVRAKVVGEGANLGVTQRGRIEYALNGGAINSDAIDNSAGVNSSDLEVNIKIAVGPLLKDGTFTQEQRNAFLATMTPEVAALCLRNNYLQTLALSLSERQGLAELPDHRELMLTLEARGLLSRRVEFLPAESVIGERAARGKALTRPELAVLLAYAKLTLYADLLDSDIPDDHSLTNELFRYFPETLHHKYPETVITHRLRREVIATVLANAIVNRGGPAFVTELMAATSAGVGDVAKAYVTTRDIYGLSALNDLVDELDGKVAGAAQLALYQSIRTLLQQEVLWFLRNSDLTLPLPEIIERHAKGVATLRDLLPTLVAPGVSESIRAAIDSAKAAGAPDATARKIAELPVLSYASDIVLVGERGGVSFSEAARAFFGVFAIFDLWAVLAQGRALVLEDRFDRMALDRALANLMRAQRDLSIDALSSGKGSVEDRIMNWKQSRAAGIERAAGAVAELKQGQLSVSRLSVAAGLLGDLARRS